MTWGGKRRGRPRKATPEQAAEARRLYWEEHLTRQQIAARLGCSVRTVARMLQEPEEGDGQRVCAGSG